MARSIVVLLAIYVCGTQALAQEWREKSHPDLAFAYEQVYGAPERIFDATGPILERIDGVGILGLRDYVTDVPGAPQPTVKAFAWIRGPVDAKSVETAQRNDGATKSKITNR